MSEVERRDVLIASVGLATAALAAASPAQAGDSSFMNNVPDPLLSGDELPTFKFALEKSEGKVIGSSYGKEAVADFQEHLRSFHAARTLSDARTSLARNGGRVGIRHRRSSSHHRH